MSGLGLGLTLGLGGFEGLTPDLSLNFEGETLDPRITFTRASTGTYVDSTGTIQTAAVDEARFDHDPATLAEKGLLIEESRTNLLTDNADFTQSAWTKDNTTIAPNAIASPDGLATADKLVENSSAATHSTNQTVTTAASTTYTFSVFAKAAGRNYAALRLGGAAFGGSTIRVAYDLTDGSTNVDSGTPDDYGAEDAGNGWYRIYIVATTTTGGASSPVIYAKDALAGAISYSGDGSSGVYLWGAQLEVGSFPTSYIPTPSSFTSRASTATYFDSAGVMQTAAVDEARTGYKLINGTWTSMGLLLEAAATNLLLRSEEFDNASWTKSEMTVTANAATAPDGATAMDKLIPSATDTANHQVEQSISVTNGTGYTLSCFMQAAGYNFGFLQQNYSGGGYATFDLSTGEVDTISGVDDAGIEDLGGGVYRCWIYSVAAETASRQHRVRAYNASGLPSFAGDTTSGIYAWGIQAEANSYATSYIPTTTGTVTRSADVSSSSTVTRNADNASITGTAFSDWYNASEGTVFVEGQGLDSSAQNNRVLQIDDGTSNDRIIIQANASANLRLFVSDGGVGQAAIVPTPTVNIATPFKFAAAFKANDFAASVNGSAAATESSGTMPTVDTMRLGNGTGSTHLNGHIKNIRFYPSRLPDATLQDLTT